MWDFPDQGWNLWPLQWELRVLTTGHQGSPPPLFSFLLCLWAVTKQRELSEGEATKHSGFAFFLRKKCARPM